MSEKKCKFRFIDYAQSMTILHNQYALKFPIQIQSEEELVKLDNLFYDYIAAIFSMITDYFPELYVHNKMTIPFFMHDQYVHEHYSELPGQKIPAGTAYLALSYFCYRMMPLLHKNQSIKDVSAIVAKSIDKMFTFRSDHNTHDRFIELGILDYYQNHVPKIPFRGNLNDHKITICSGLTVYSEELNWKTIYDHSRTIPAGIVPVQLYLCQHLRRNKSQYYFVLTFDETDTFDYSENEIHPTYQGAMQLLNMQKQRRKMKKGVLL